MSVVADLPDPWSYSYISPPEIGNDGTIWSSRITFYCTYANLTTFLLKLSGTPTVLPLPGGGTITRIRPLQHPLYSAQWAKQVQAVSFGTPASTFTDLTSLFSHAEVTVYFESVPYATDASDTPYMTMTIDDGGVYTTIPGRKLSFPTGEVLGQDAGIFVGQTTYNITLYQCPTMSDVVLNGLMNRYNLNPFLGNPPGSMLFNTWKGDYQLTAGGVLTYTKQLMFTFQDHHWNQFFRSDGVLDTPTDPAGNTVFQSGDFSTITGS